MAIKAGDLVAAVPGSPPTMISDGNRMRVFWLDGHGDGDPTKHIVDRSKTTVRGHPTWKLYCGDVPSPIYRGRREPPKYVYLDDRACYTIYKSRFYDNKELQTFWPYDFDNLGNIKANRPNRGRPAYLDAACTKYAKGPLRGRKAEGYEFCGAPVSSEQHAPHWRVKREAERAHAEKIQAGSLISLSGAIPVMTSTSAQEKFVTRKAQPIVVDVSPARFARKQQKPISNSHIKYESGPVDGTLKPLSITDKATQSSPYSNVPATIFRKRSRPMPGDTAAAYTGLDSERNAELAGTETAMKQKRLKVKQQEGDLDE